MHLESKISPAVVTGIIFPTATTWHRSSCPFLHMKKLNIVVTGSFVKVTHAQTVTSLLLEGLCSFLHLLPSSQILASACGRVSLGLCVMSAWWWWLLQRSTSTTQRGSQRAPGSLPEWLSSVPVSRHLPSPVCVSSACFTFLHSIWHHVTLSRFVSWNVCCHRNVSSLPLLTAESPAISTELLARKRPLRTIS